VCAVRPSEADGDIMLEAIYSAHGVAVAQMERHHLHVHRGGRVDQHDALRRVLQLDLGHRAETETEGRDERHEAHGGG
jgi:hypothetical protein